MKKERSLDEWHFDFGLYAMKDDQLIPEAHCDELLDLIVQWAEKREYGVGGGVREFESQEIRPSHLGPDDEGA